MKNIFMASLLFASQAFAGLPPTTLKAQTETSATTTFNFQTPFNQATTTASGTRLVETGNYNLLPNPGFEASTYSSGWTASGGSSAVGTGSDIGFGNKSYKWTPASGGQTLTSTAITIPEGLKGTNGYLSCRIKTPNGNPGWSSFQIGAYDGTNMLTGTYTVPSNIISFDTFTVVGTNFIFPTSGTIALRIISAAGQLGDIDDCILGPATNLGAVQQAKNVVQFIWTGSQTATHDTDVLFTWSGATQNKLENFTFSSGIFTATLAGDYQYKFCPRMDYTPANTGVMRDVLAKAYKNSSTVPLEGGINGYVGGLAQNNINGGGEAPSGTSSGSLGIAPPCAFGTTTLAAGDTLRFKGYQANGNGNNFNWIAGAVEINFFPTVAQQAVRTDCTLTGACVNTFSAEFSSSCVVSKENVDWINGNGVGGTGICDFTFNTSFFSVAPNCTIMSQSGLFSFTNGSASTSTVQTRTYNAAGTNTAAAGILTCYRQGTDLKPAANVPVYVGLIFSGSAGALRQETIKLGTNCAMTTQSSAWATPSGSSSSTGCTLTFAAGMFTAEPTCQCTAYDAGGAVSKLCSFSAFSSSALTYFITTSTTGSGFAGTANITCTGPR